MQATATPEPAAQPTPNWPGHIRALRAIRAAARAERAMRGSVSPTTLRALHEVLAAAQAALLIDDARRLA